MSLFKDMCNDIRMDEKETENNDYEYIRVEEEADDHITVFDILLSKEKKRGKGKPDGRTPPRKKDGKSMDM